MVRFSGKCPEFTHNAPTLTISIYSICSLYYVPCNTVMYSASNDYYIVSVHVAALFVTALYELSFCTPPKVRIKLYIYIYIYINHSTGEHRYLPIVKHIKSNCIPCKSTLIDTIAGDPLVLH